MSENPGVADAGVTPFVSCPWDPRLCQAFLRDGHMSFREPTTGRRGYWLLSASSVFRLCQGYNVIWQPEKH